MKTEKWHALSVDSVLKQFNTTLNGLSTSEVYCRLKQYGLNKLTKVKKENAWRRFISQFNNILIYVLLVAAGITSLLGFFVDALVILCVVFLNAFIGFMLEGKAETAIEALGELLSLQANVIRDGNRTRVLAEQLVPGDVVLLRSGDKVPADLRLVKAVNLQIQEAILTGESLPVEKNIHPVNIKVALSEKSSMAFASTFVTYGSGVGIVTAIGDETEIGHISSMLIGLPKLSTPLLRQISLFGRWLAISILCFSLAIFLFGVFVRGYSILEMFMAAVAIAVSVIPEGLPALLTITLAVGVTRMAQRNAIIRRLPAVETLSAVDVICTDKTGTLTRNELTVQSIITTSHEFHVSGTGYNDRGKIRKYNQEVLNIYDYPDLVLLIRAGVLCNDAELKIENESWVLHGNPIDGALLALGLKTNLDHKKEIADFPRLDFIPFESMHKFMACLHHDQFGNFYIFVKGAPERILEMSTYQLNEGKRENVNKEYWLSRINSLAQNGMRVLALAYREIGEEQETLLFKDAEKNLVFLGLIGVIDSPREEVPHAIMQCLAAGIHIKIVTGDHSKTAVSIAKQIGLLSQRVLTGESLDAMTDEMLVKRVNDIDIYARTTPEHKLRIIRALRKNGYIIAMTGDGVNDAPALLHADIGIAMGIKGTDVAREAAEIVLTDDDFSTIAQAVIEGRAVYENIKKAILFILPNDGAEGFSIFIAILFGYTLPITPLQILWVNLVTTVTLGLALAFEPPEKDIMSHPPRDPKEPLLSKFLLWRIGFVSFLFVCAIFGLFIYEIYHGTDLIEARTIVVNMLVFAEFVYLVNCQSIYRPVFSKKVFMSNKAVIISIAIVFLLQVGFTYLPIMQNFFKTKAIGFQHWILIAILSLVIFMIIECEKMIVLHYQHKKHLKGP